MGEVLHYKFRPEAEKLIKEALAEANNFASVAQKLIEAQVVSAGTVEGGTIKQLVLLVLSLQKAINLLPDFLLVQEGADFYALKSQPHLFRGRKMNDIHFSALFWKFFQKPQKQIISRAHII